MVRLLRANGFAAKKASARYKPGEDIQLRLLGVDRRIEVKARADGFPPKRDRLQNRDILIIKADRQPPLVILRLSDVDAGGRTRREIRDRPLKTLARGAIRPFEAPARLMNLPPLSPLP
jgi:hypothetical protein